MATVGMSDVKKGLCLVVGEVPYKIVEFQHVKPGKGVAFVRMKMKSYLNGKVVEKTVHAGDKFEVPEIVYKTMQYLYDDGEMYQFMDNETYDQIGLTYEQCDEASKCFKDGISVEIIFYKNKAISVQTPEFMELVVTDTPPNFKGDTSSGSKKPVTNDNNLNQGTEKSIVAKMMESMALIKTLEEKRKLKESACGCTLGEWRLKSQAKCGGVGFGTGVLGGPVGLALEVADTGYLIAMAGQACYGVGHILNKPIDYDRDIEGILAIWSGTGKSASSREVDLTAGTGLTLLPIGGKLIAKVSTKVASKIVAKIAFKASSKIVGKAGAKVAGKIAGKMSTKWIPFVGGIVSAGINIWVIDGMINAAAEYYKADYILLDNIDD